MRCCPVQRVPPVWRNLRDSLAAANPLQTSKRIFQDLPSVFTLEAVRDARRGGQSGDLRVQPAVRRDQRRRPPGGWWSGSSVLLISPSDLMKPTLHKTQNNLP